MSPVVAVACRLEQQKLILCTRILTSRQDTAGACCSKQKPASPASTHLSSPRCVRVSMSNGLHKTRGHKHPWVYWQRSRTLFVLYSLSRALFTALFTRYRSHIGSVLLVCLRLRGSQQRPVLTNLNWIRVTSRPFIFIALFWPNTSYMTFYSP